MGDARRLGQVLINLLCNAHQHTPSGTHITITGRIENGEIRLTGADDGPGIPESEREAIFERFYRLSAAGGGSGLGLAIARGLVGLHGGRMWVESPHGRRKHVLHCAPVRAIEGGTMTLKLFIADDAADVAEVIAFGARMTWPDCQVAIASRGVQALRAFAADPPDLVVLDVTMPAPDGFEVCRRIRDDLARADPHADGARRDDGQGARARPGCRRLL